MLSGRVKVVQGETQAESQVMPHTVIDYFHINKTIVNLDRPQAVLLSKNREKQLNTISQLKASK